MLNLNNLNNLGVFVVGAKRTPFGAYGGKLRDKSSIEMAEIASKAALKAANVNPELVNSVVVGNVIQVFILHYLIDLQ